MLSFLPRMSSKCTLTLVIFLITLLATKVTAEPPTKPTYFAEVCRTKTGNYTSNSTYETNLKAVLFDLQGRASTASFYNTSSGLAGTEDQVFGQYYCRGDIDTQLCHDCIKQAAASIFNNCPNFKGAVIWYEECTLRYQNASMVGVESELPSAYWSSNATVPDSEKFEIVLNSTINRIINETVSGNGTSFATGEGYISQFETAYCLAQCSPDLNSTECDTCLRSAYSFIPDCCGKWSQFVFVFYPSCQLRYSTEGAFYTISSAPPPLSLTPPPPPPPPVLTSSPPKGGSAILRSRESMNLGVVITALALASLSLG